MGRQRDLTDKQRQFCKEYVVDFNATQAAIRAGYAKNGARQTAHKLVSNTDIQAAIKHEATRRAEAAEVSAERVVAELARVGFANMADYMVVGEDGLPRLNWREVTRDQAAALSQVTVDVVGAAEDEDDDERPVQRVRFKLESKISALEKLGKYFGLFTDKVQHSGSLELTGERPEHRPSDEELEQIIANRRANGE